MKKKIKITFFVLLYILAYLYLCILCNIGETIPVYQTPLRGLVYLLDSPINSLVMSWSLYLWVCVAFFLVLFIIWQMDLKGPKLNRAAFIGFGITFILTCISFIITSIIEGSEVLGTVLGIVIAIALCFGGGFLLFYYMMKKQGRLDTYETYKDILTEDEFYRWQQRKDKND